MSILSLNTASTIPTSAPGSLPESTTLLAKLLAREDIEVVFSPGAETASFNSVTRRLVLPVWQNMSESLNDMLVAHEVGHALHTPKTEAELVSAIAAVDSGMSNEAKMYLNVVEDIRIEREIKEEFPGSRKCFAIGYRELLAGGFFALDALPMEERTLCDRINIHSKVGFAVNVPFDSYEQEILDAAMATQTWEDVIENAKAIWEYDGTIGRDKIREIQSQRSKINAPSMESNQEDSNDSGSNALGAQNSDSPKESESGDSGNSSNSTESAEEGNSNSKNGDKESGEGNLSGKAHVPNTNSKEFASPAAPNSMESLERNIRNLRDNFSPERMYGVFPEPNLDSMMIRWSVVHGDLSHWLNHNLTDSTIKQVVQSAYSMFSRETGKQVSLMVREFERRRAAITHRRNRTGVRGVIDVNRLHSYRFSEDIFKTYTATKDGKSHAMVMFVDWSSSMSPVIGDTVNQTISLASFCRRAGIPFEVYAFSSASPTTFANIPGMSAEDAMQRESTLWSKKENDLVAHGFTLLNLLSSKMNRREFEEASRNLVMLSDYHGQNEFVNRAKKNHGSRVMIPYGKIGAYGLGGTPLNSAILTAFDILPKFRTETRAQVLTAIFLTDGDATDNILCARYDANGNSTYEPTTGARKPGTWNVPIFARHRSSKRTFKLSNQNWGAGEITETLLTELRNHTGARILGFKILHRSWNQLLRPHRGEKIVHYDIEKHFTAGNSNSTRMPTKTLVELVEKAENDGVLTVPYSDGSKITRNSYDELYIFSAKSMSVSGDDELSALSDNASLTKIRNAFMKQSSSGKTSRVFLNRFIPMVAESL